MIVRTLEEVVGSDDDVSAEGWTSRRLLLARHGMGFSMHDTIIEPGAELVMWYRHHLEAVYCVEGEGEIEERATGRTWPVAPGTVYALDQHDPHVLRARTRMRMVCAFNPPLTGDEVHDADGAYALAGVEASDPPSDPYRTRVAAAERVARADPVVWGSPGEDAELEALVARYRTDGFVVLPRVLDAGDIADWIAEAARCAEDAPEGTHVVLEPSGDTVRSVFRVHDAVPAFTELASHPRVLSFARRILGDSVYVHQSRVNYKRGLAGREFDWHSDFETWHAEDGMPRMRALTCVVMLTENTEHNGPLLMIPGSHRTYVRCVGQAPDQNHVRSLRRQVYGVPDVESLRALADEGGIVSATGAPGTVIFFDCNLLHASAANLTPWPRTNTFFVYNGLDNRLVAPFSGGEPRPGYLAARGADQREPHALFDPKNEPHP